MSTAAGQLLQLISIANETALEIIGDIKFYLPLHSVSEHPYRSYATVIDKLQAVWRVSSQSNVHLTGLAETGKQSLRLEIDSPEPSERHV